MRFEGYIDDKIFDISESSLTDLLYMYVDLDRLCNIFINVFTDYIKTNDYDDYNVKNIFVEHGEYKQNFSSGLLDIRYESEESDAYKRGIYLACQDLVLYAYCLYHTCDYIIEYMFKEEVEILKLKYIKESIDLIMK